VDSNGVKNFISITHPEFGTSINITRVVQANDGNLYAAGNFLIQGLFVRPALYDLDQPSLPLVTWNYGIANAIDSNRIVFGNIESIAEFEATRFFLDGSFQPMSYPGGGASLNSATPNGYALGDAHIPGTAGAEPAFWTPSGVFSFFGTCCISSSIRDREDDSSVNIGWDRAGIKYGSGSPIHIFDENGLRLGGLAVLVSQSDFAVVLDSDTDLGNFAFYPNIVPGFPDRAMPLLNIFPELATIDIDVIHDLASVDGYLYMTLSGADGTFLFGARDPSAVVPEPTAILLASIAALFGVRRRTHRF
jgi:hypothetical protein